MAMSLSSTSGGSCSRVSTASAADSTARTLAPDCSSTAATHSRAPASSSTRSTRTPRRLGLGWNSPPVSAGCGATPRTASDPGSLTVNVAPCPLPLLSTSIVPRCSSTRSWTIASPRPRPPCPRVLLLSACWKGSKMCGRNCGSIPSPSSRTEMMAWPSARASRRRTRPPRGENLTAFERRFHMICWRRAGSPWTDSAPSSETRSTRTSFASASARTASSAAPAPPLTLLDGPRQRGDDVVAVDRLLDEIVGPAAQREHREVVVTVPRDEHRRRVGPERPDLGEQGEAVHPGHLDVGDDRVVVDHADPTDRFRRRVTRVHLDALQPQPHGFGEGLQQGGVVVDDEYAGHVHLAGSAGRGSWTMKVAPSPPPLTTEIVPPCSLTMP